MGNPPANGWLDKEKGDGKWQRKEERSGIPLELSGSVGLVGRSVHNCGVSRTDRMIQRGRGETRNEGYQESTGERVDINMIPREAKTTRDLTIGKGSGSNRNVEGLETN